MGSFAQGTTHGRTKEAEGCAIFVMAVGWLLLLELLWCSHRAVAAATTYVNDLTNHSIWSLLMQHSLAQLKQLILNNFSPSTIFPWPFRCSLMVLLGSVPFLVC